MTSTIDTPGRRLDSLDVLRGIALLGIALMNVEYFTSPLMDMGSGIGAGLEGADLVADAFVYVFVQGKFWTLFSMLFGMGFAIMLQRASMAGAAFAPRYLRRTLGLLVIGLAHALLVWAGDILASYAVAALALMLCFRDTATGRLWRWGLGLWVAVAGLMLLGALLAMAGGDAEPPPGTAEAMAAVAQLREAELATYASGSYADATALRMRYFVHALPNEILLLPLVLGMFLTGAWLVRSGTIVEPARHRRRWLVFAWGAGGAGLAVTLASVGIDPGPSARAGFDPTALLAMSLQLIGAPLLALGYVAAVVLALEAGWRGLRVFAPAGRMALTNYLLQSVVGTLVFYGYGLGLWGQVPRSAQVLGVVAVFALQLLASRWWLSRFRFGPVEWLWRAFTYAAWPPLRRPREPGLPA